jgi:glycosyltransferase involved in cell wall biosynthesis
MTILLLTHSYPDISNTWRGSFIRDQANLLSIENKVIVVWFSIDYQNFAPVGKYQFSKTVSGNLTEYKLTTGKSFPVITQLKYLLQTYRFIKAEILSQYNPDLIHSHLSYPAGFLGTLLQKRINIPVVITEHSRITNYFRSPLHKLCIFYTLKNAASFISVSNALKAEITSVYPRPVKVIYNIVDTNKFRLSSTVHDNLINIGFLGGLGNNNKGLDLLLKAASLLDHNRYFFHIGGQGKMLGDYIRMADEYGVSENCKFYGAIPMEKITDFYSYLDIFILPSRYETFGIVLIEAMASGIPVISTRCGGPEEIVTGSTGILVEKDNFEELAKAITIMSDNLKSYNKGSIRKYAEETFGKQVFIDAITSYYRETITNFQYE